MIKRNACFSMLTAGYLFPEIARRRREYQAAHPDAEIISLGIGNTTEPLTPVICGALTDYAKKLSTPEGYSGYGDECGNEDLRTAIAQNWYKGTVSPDEVFVSDGAKCDIARIQTLFGADVSVAVQDPAYPVYVDGSVISGAAGTHKPMYGNEGYGGIVYMPCTAENSFFPDLTKVQDNSLIYFCSPNNPTGAAATREQLTKLVEFAKAHGCIIIFDAAYACFIRDESLPRSIFDIEGAKTCAIEINSFSKPAGFTGVRLGWSVVPKELKYEDESSVNTDWARVNTTLFNGASNIAQAGGVAAMSPEGQAEMRALTDYYLENARIIRETLLSARFADMGVEVYGGDNAPYIWARFPGYRSWNVFDKILDQCRVVTTPGVGFGPAGESFIRFSAFGHRAAVEEACRRLATTLVLE
ncbi:MAG: LL-diaminopimelate aminotransferase [Treponemataceae bacterium]|nr:LL-diaminopimelate aminotransferase [Treponemataceae bacterium]